MVNHRDSDILTVVSKKLSSHFTFVTMYQTNLLLRYFIHKLVGNIGLAMI
jgi:hypothetical protein